MPKTLAIGLAMIVSLSLGAAPAFANYGNCTENPSAKGCPGYIAPMPEAQSAAQKSSPRHVAHNSREHSTPQKG